mmetsp:Transcript_10112/g.30909  ORF Transcript_10112/g.30909 Transcript_10112/m.30909 type:complete len:349 (-) Transcript_10112:133-1179(-)
MSSFRALWIVVLVGCNLLLLDLAHGLLLKVDGTDEMEKFYHHLRRRDAYSARKLYNYEGNLTIISGDPCVTSKEWKIENHIVLYNHPETPCSPAIVEQTVQGHKAIALIWLVKQFKNFTITQELEEELLQIRMPVAYTSSNFLEESEELIRSQGHAYVVLNGTGDSILEQTVFDRLFRPMFSLVWPAMLGATFATGALLLASVCSATLTRIREWFATRWRLQRITQIPSKQYIPVDSNEEETCTICLETFEPGEKINVFPCSHIYHRDCIVTWLVRSQLCPVCKRDVFEEPEEGSGAQFSTSVEAGSSMRPRQDPDNGTESPSQLARRSCEGREFVTVNIEDTEDGAQ